MQKIWSGDSIKCYQGICFHRNCPLNVRLIASCEYCSRINWWCSVFIYSCRGRKATFKYAYIHQLWDDQEDYGWKWNKGKQHQNTLMWILIFIYKPGLSQARTRKYLRCTFHNHEIFCPKLKTSKIWVGSFMREGSRHCRLKLKHFLPFRMSAHCDVGDVFHQVACAILNDVATATCHAKGKTSPSCPNITLQ